MDPLTFVVCSDTPEKESSPLKPCPPDTISTAMWDELAACIANEGSLIPYPADALAQRCYEGYSAVAIAGGRIVSYISLAPVVLRDPGIHSWTVITAGLGFDREIIPGADIYEFTNSWTDPAWRRQRISLALRPPLIERYLQGSTLGLSGMIGLASRVLARLGWQIIAWDAIPYVSSLNALPADDFPDYLAYGWRSPEELRRYQGPHLPLDTPNHPWEKYSYCWVSDPVIARQLDQELASLMHGDLNRWRQAVVTAFTRPDSPHKLAFHS